MEEFAPTPISAATTALKLDPNGTKLSNHRRAALSRAGLPIPRLALEIGAFDNPTIRSDDGFAVRYVDYFSAAELRTAHAGNIRRRLDKIVDVDYVIKGPKISPFIKEEIDLIVANHVIEHLPDPIGWLRDVATFCSSKSSIFLAVPDQRYTFDRLKQATDLTDLVMSHDMQKTQPSAYDIARMRYLHMNVDLAKLWHGEANSAPHISKDSYSQILQQARTDADTGYIDVHCTYYTAHSFIHIFQELYRSKFIPWEPTLVEETQRYGNEFCVALRLG